METILWLVSVDLAMQKAFALMDAGRVSDGLALMRAIYAKMNCSCGDQLCVVGQTKAKVKQIISEVEMEVVK